MSFSMKRLAMSVCALAMMIAPARAANELQERIDAALAAGEKQLVIPPGVYRVAPPRPGRPHVLIKNAKDLSIIADGVTMVCTSMDQALRIDDSTGLTIQGLTIDYDPLPFTQGVVVALADDHTWLEMKLDAGYPAAEADKGRRGILYDPATRLVKPGAWTRFGVTVAPRENGLVRLSWSNPMVDTAAVGDLVALTRKTITPHGIFVSNGRNCTFKNVTLHASTSFGVFEVNGGGNSYIGCHIVPGAPPPGATAAPLLSSQADGIHSRSASPGPRIENCVLDSMGDDAVAIHGDAALVVAAEGKSLIVSPKRELEFKVGDRLNGMSAKGQTTPDARIISIEPIPADQAPDARAVQLKYFPDLRLASSFWKQSFRIELDHSLGLSEGWLVASHDRTGSGFVVENNTIRNTRARGILVKASDGLITHNTIEHATLAGIVLCAESRFWLEANYCHNVVIRDNVLRDIGHGAMNAGMVQAGAITLCSEGPGPAGGHQNITIENNTIKNTVGVNIEITSSTGVLVRGNKFVDAHETEGGHGGNFGIDPSATIWITQSKDVTVENNQMVNPGPYTGKLVVTTDTAENITIKPQEK